MGRKLIYLLLAIFIMNIDAAVAMADDGSPFTIIRASLDENNMWEIHRFSLLGDAPPATIRVPPGALGLECTILEYPLFRARYTLGFEESLREGLAMEYQRREKIKNAADFGAFIYCSPFWPIHLFNELPFTGIEKEKMLQFEGYTLQLPMVQSGFTGESPLIVLNEMSTGVGEDMSGTYNIELPAGPVEGEDWSGAGLHLSYYLPLTELPVPSRVIYMDELFAGYPQRSSGTAIILIDIPAMSVCNVKIGSIDREMVFSSWPGNYERHLGTATYVVSSGRAYIGIRRIKVHNADSISFGVMPERESERHTAAGEQDWLMTSWPALGSVADRYSFPLSIIPTAIISFIIYHLANIAWLRINYRKDPAGAVYDPIVSHLILLAIASVFVPFFGLGWIAGAYAAGKFLRWRHPDAHRPWLIMLTYALLVGIVYEAMFMRTLWI